MLETLMSFFEYETENMKDHYEAPKQNQTWYLFSKAQTFNSILQGHPAKVSPGLPRELV